MIRARRSNVGDDARALFGQNPESRTNHGKHARHDDHGISCRRSPGVRQSHPFPTAHWITLLMKNMKVPLLCTFPSLYDSFLAFVCRGTKFHVDSDVHAHAMDVDTKTICLGLLSWVVGLIYFLGKYLCK